MGMSIVERFEIDKLKDEVKALTKRIEWLENVPPTPSTPLIPKPKRAYHRKNHVQNAGQ